MEFKWNEFNLTTYDDVKPFVEELLSRPVKSDADFRKWLSDENYMTKWFFECFALANIEKDRSSTPENFEKFQALYKNARMPYESALNKIAQKTSDLSLHFNPRIRGFEGYAHRLKTQLELYREENNLLQASVSKFSDDFFKLQNSLEINVDGELISFSAAQELLRSMDREKRKNAFEILARAETTIAPDLDKALTEIIALRVKMAKNAGYDNTLEYLTKSIERLDYDLESVKQLHRSVKKLFVPLFGKLNLYKKSSQGYEQLYPWDISSDFFSFPAESLFTNTEDFLMKVLKTLDEIDPEISGYFLDIYNVGNFDLEPRLNKKSGAYQCFLPYSGIPFIFGNIVQNITQYRIMFHEMGHALHSFLSKPNFFRQIESYPTEVAELASQALELISTSYYAGHITGKPEDEPKFRFEALKSAIASIVYPCIQDEFCHWIYENPDHTPAQRKEKWNSLYSEYYLYIDNSQEENKRFGYRYIAHFYFAERPLYHIEYTISMIGAVQIYFNSKQDLSGTLAKYKNALRLGYSASIPEIYKTAGVDFDFSEQALAGLAKSIDEELSGLIASLPEKN